jgi:tetratricopeptide (TPR) repeat protein
MAPAQAALGEFYVTVGRNDQAEQPLRDALTVYEKKYGDDHPLLEDVLIDLAALYENKGDMSQGREYAERAQAIHQKSAGYSHLPDVSVRTLKRVTPP